MNKLFFNLIFFSPGLNLFYIPAGILHTYLFNPDAPQYLNYAAIAGIIGHEITHGFDSGGHKYDEEGK